MVANHHGYESDLASLRRRFAISLKGSTLKGLVQIASSMGLGSRAARWKPRAPQLGGMTF